MATVKVSEMATATSFENDDYTMIVQNNKNKKITKQNMLGNIENNISDINDNIEIINTNVGNINDELDTITTYSTDEQVIGTWIDGKPIYRRCIYIASFPNSTTANIDVSNLNIDYIVNLYGYAKVDNSRGFPINNARPDTNMDSCIGVWYDTTLKISTGLDRSNCSGYIIIEYTKTTD